jgi:hypothetical protein
MNETVISKALYLHLQKAGIPFEGWVDFGGGMLMWVVKVVNIVNVPFNKYGDHFVKMQTASVCVMDNTRVETKQMELARQKAKEVTKQVHKEPIQEEPEDSELVTQELDLLFFVGTGVTASSELLYSKDLGTWMGKNLKFYNKSWGGNQFTGGKLKFAGTWAKPFRYGSNILGWYGIGSSLFKGLDGKISPEEATGDVIFGGAAIYSGFYGNVANVFYNLGKEYGPMTLYLRYQEKKKHRSELLDYMKEKGYFK